VILVVRVVAIAVAVAIGAAVLMWLATGERKWLRIARRIFTYALFAVLLILVLMAGERLLAEA
jgi:hypothetical protein